MSNLLHPDYNSPSALKKFMEDNGMAMQKKFGQNFLTNEKARVKIIDELDINENSTVWEVGPGLGSMTSEILKRGADLTVFEIDRGFISFLHQFFEEAFLYLFRSDFLKNMKKKENSELLKAMF